MRRKPRNSSSPSEIIPPERLSQLQKLQKKIQISFSNISLLDQAFTHRSFSNESKLPVRDNERLEFLGDSVLGLIAAEFLYLQSQNVNEGVLAKRKSKLVSGPALAKLCEDWGLISYLRFGKGEMDSGKTNKRVMENLVEAMIGAVYLEHGFSACKSWILPKIQDLFGELGTNESVKDYKSLLQEKSQKQFKKIPHYDLVSEEGLDHDKTFQIRVTLPNGFSKLGEGKNKRSAEQNAAKLLLQSWKDK